MSYPQTSLRSFVNTEGKLLLCNESFFSHFGCCTEHLIGKSVTDVVASGAALAQAIQHCQSHPGECISVETEKQCTEGCLWFRWIVYAEEGNGKITGVHLIGDSIAPPKAA